MSERPADILPRMISDRWRVERGERRLTEALANGTLTQPVGALVLDVDGSGPVRALGIGPKIRLVEQVRQLVRGLTPPDAIVVDSGSRDEVYVILPDPDGTRIGRLGEQIRAAVADHVFPVAEGHDARVTVSVGVAVMPAPRDGADVLERTRDALRGAKAVRDHVFTAQPGDGIECVAVVPAATLRELHRRGADPDAAARTGLGALQEKHGPVWYWVGERGGADEGVIPDIPYTLDDDTVPAAAVAFFDHLVAAVSLEAALTRLATDGTPAEVSVAADPPGSGLAARYHAGEWVLARGATGERSPGENLFAVIQAARDGSTEMTKVPVRLGPNGAAIVAAVADRHGRAVPDLLGEALQLAVDHWRAWDRP